MFHPWCQTRDNSFGRIPPKIADKICVTYHKWRGYYFILKWNSGTIIPHFHDLPSILSPFQWKHTMTRYLVPGIYIDFANTANHSICHWRVYSSGEKVIYQHYWHIDKNEYMNSRFLQTKTHYLITQDSNLPTDILNIILYSTLDHSATLNSYLFCKFLPIKSFWFHD